MTEGKTLCYDFKIIVYKLRFHDDLRLYFYHIKFMHTAAKNILYYTAIAEEYNKMLEKKPDKAVRAHIATRFCSIVEATAVLDFGGGTGLDLSWLSDKYPAVFFCEPSPGMREKAIQSRADVRNDNVIFLDGPATDFRQWDVRLPFKVKVDAVLSNFAVFNCIPDIDLLFRSLALVVRPGGNVIALVLTKNMKILKGNLGNILRSFLHSAPATVDISYKEHRQTVYIYSVKEITKASKKYFAFCDSEVLRGYGFTFLHLRRNERVI